MSLIICSECGKEFSDKAPACPNCGCPVEYVKKEENTAYTTSENETIEGTHNDYYSSLPKKVAVKSTKKRTPLAIISLVLSILSVFFIIDGFAILLCWIAIIFGFISIKTREGRIALPIIGIVVGFIFGFASFSVQLSHTSAVQQPESKEFANQEETSQQIYTETEPEYKESCKSDYKYKDVLRNPKNYIGQRITVDVKVQSVHKEGLLNSVTYYFANANDEYDFWYGDTYAIFDKTDGSLKILESDIIRVYGIICEPQDTVSLVVNSQELFGIEMKYAELIGE